MKMMRCQAHVDIHLSGANPRTESLWPGLEVDFDRELRPGFTVADAIQGREAAFEPVASGTAE